MKKRRTGNKPFKGSSRIYTERKKPASEQAEAVGHGRDLRERSDHCGNPDSDPVHALIVNEKRAHIPQISTGRKGAPDAKEYRSHRSTGYKGA